MKNLPEGITEGCVPDINYDAKMSSQEYTFSQISNFMFQSNLEIMKKIGVKPDKICKILDVCDIKYTIENVKMEDSIGK